MSARSTRASVLIALITVILTTQAQAALAELLTTARPNSIEPFDELAHLLGAVRDDLPHSVEAGLGHVMQLSTFMRAKTSSSMSTRFHIYRRGKFTKDITFRSKTPATSAGGPPDLANDFQYNLEMMRQSGFDVAKKTVIMIPGYLSDHEEQWAREAMHAWLSLYGDDINVVVLSWADSNRCIYSKAVATTPIVARQVTVFLHYLAQLSATHLADQQFLDRLHLIGHSLGAHICGFVGQDLNGRVGRITGLDPAGPTFDTFPTNQRLDRSDARLVEVLHTNAGRMKYMKALSGLLMHAISSSASSQFQGETTAWFGIDENVGHIDYYANNGRTQEGCTGSLHVCDHGRAGEIYVDLLQYEAYLRAGGQTSGATRQTSRLWAFRANDYEAFRGGVSLLGLCPELVRAESHLLATEVAKSFKHCSAPLLDFMTPVDELVRELRDEFGIDFGRDAAPEKQPRYYFRTQMSTETAATTHFIGDHFLLRIYLDRDSTSWDSSECTLSVHLHLSDGEKITFEASKIDRVRAFMAPPFAHSQGAKAHINLQQLLGSLANGTRHSDHFAQLFSKLFPRTISLGFATLTQSGETPSSYAPGISNCVLGVKLIEVHPLSFHSQHNMGALYGGRPLLPGQDLEFVKASELEQRLASIAPTILSFGQMNSLGVSLESAIVDS